MGAKHASVHLRCDDSTEVLTKLKGAFRKKKGPSTKDLLAMEIIKAFANKNISEITDPNEKAEKESTLTQMMKEAQKDMGEGDPAIIVVREHFVSIYWYDHIRIENLREEMKEYAYLCGVQALGVGLFDDTNFSIYAVCNTGKPDARGCRGEYLFDYEDITPVEAEDICDIIDAPFYLEGMKKVLAADDGETMAAIFEEETGLPIYMDDKSCEEYSMKKLYEWEHATVFLVEK